MIHYQLTCHQDHDFEGWFRSSEAFDQQAKRKLIACPLCGSTDVGKAPMAPRIARGPAAERSQKLANIQKEMVASLGKLRRHIEENFENVGPDFVDTARKIHYGEADSRAIYGEASDDEAAALEEEGIPFGRIPWARGKPT
ncbi:MAG: DUF1178 family protein [Alphaproteobacteria bacterium]